MKKQIFKSYAKKISELYDVDLSSIFKKNKKRAVVDARQMLYYLCFKRNMKIVYIQSFMREEGYSVAHSSIIHGIDVVTNNVETDEDYRIFIKNINECVTA